MTLMVVWCSMALEELCVQVPLAAAALEAAVMNTHRAVLLTVRKKMTVINIYSAQRAVNPRTRREGAGTIQRM